MGYTERAKRAAVSSSSAIVCQFVWLNVFIDYNEILLNGFSAQKLGRVRQNCLNRFKMAAIYDLLSQTIYYILKPKLTKNS